MAAAEANGASSANGTTAAAEKPTDVEAKIIQQVEFYFGDVNLQRDKFILGEMKKDDGWIPMSTMLKFNRLSKLSADATVIMSALRKSTSGLMEVDAETAGGRIRRATVLPENSLEYWKTVRARTVYVKGFPSDYTLAQLEEVLQPLGRCDHIIMRRTKPPERIFKGSVFATYADVEQCKKIVESGIKLGDTPLIVMMQNDHQKKKQMEIREKRMAERKDKKKRQIEKLGYTKGMVMRLSELADELFADEMEGVKKLKAAIESAAGVKPGWIDMAKDNKTALVRFNGAEGEAGRALALLMGKKGGGDGAGEKEGDKEKEKEEEKEKDGEAAAKAAPAPAVTTGSVDMCGHTLAAAVLGGDDEAAYHLKQQRDMQERKVHRAKERRKRNEDFTKAKRDKQAQRKRKADAPAAEEDAAPAKKVVFADSDEEEEASGEGEGDADMDASGDAGKKPASAKEAVGMHSEDSASDDEQGGGGPADKKGGAADGKEEEKAGDGARDADKKDGGAHAAS